MQNCEDDCNHRENQQPCLIYLHVATFRSFRTGAMPRCHGAVSTYRMPKDKASQASAAIEDKMHDLHATFGKSTHVSHHPVFCGSGSTKQEIVI